MSPIVLNARNVNGALKNGLTLLAAEVCVEEQTRNGLVRSYTGPVLTHTAEPTERVLFSPLRDANPFFHLFESLWMLAGRNDLPWLVQFNKGMAGYSDDGGQTQPGAYGHRWRNYFGYDQLELVLEELRTDPNSRRAVLAMWDGWGIHTFDGVHHFGDMIGARQGSKDVPCNTHCYFRILDGALFMTVCCRSNDSVWGAHGANAVHFSVLLEYMAARLDVDVGTMTQMSNNYHVYTDVVKRPLGDLVADAAAFDYYVTGEAKATPMFTPDDVGMFETDLPNFMDYAAANPLISEGNRLSPKPELDHPFLRQYAMPMLAAWDFHKVGLYDRALASISDIPDHGSDWFRACWHWLLRRRDGSDGSYREAGQ